MACKRFFKPSPKGSRRQPTNHAQSARAIVQQPVAQMPMGYGEFLDDLKARIQAARAKACDGP